MTTGFVFFQVYGEYRASLAFDLVSSRQKIVSKISDMSPNALLLKIVFVEGGVIAFYTSRHFSLCTLVLHSPESKYERT